MKVNKSLFDSSHRQTEQQQHRSQALETELKRYTTEENRTAQSLSRAHRGCTETSVSELEARHGQCVVNIKAYWPCCRE